VDGRTSYSAWVRPVAPVAPVAHFRPPLKDASGCSTAPYSKVSLGQEKSAEIMKFLFELFRKALNGARRAANRARRGRRPTRCAPFCIEEYRLGHRGTLIHPPSQRRQSRQ
jgi:hypothetical protein